MEPRNRFAVLCLLVGCLIRCVVAEVAVGEDVERSVREMARRIDEHLAARWDDKQIVPAPMADDSELVRRLYLDLTGRIPRVSEVRQFLNDPSEGKRSRLIDRLLSSSAHANHMAIRWRNIMLPDGFSTGDLTSAAGLQRWFREQFLENMRYDRIVADFLVTSGSGESGPALFYTSLGVQPERLAASTSRIFLGMQIECAQCHDHPFDDWTQEDFWGYAAFFAQLRQAPRGAMQVRLEDLTSGDVTLPGTERVVLPRYPAGQHASPGDGGTRRVQLAIWMASRNNPYLARAAVNRAWAHLFGRGLVEPVDDLGRHNPASHPDLLRDLQRYFVDSGFDLRRLYRTLASTNAYQRASRTVNDPPAPLELFSRMAIKPLTADQLYDSLRRLLVSRRSANRPGASLADQLFDPQRLEFVSRMRSTNRSATEFDAGIPQALTLMNGVEVREATDLDRSALLGALEAPFLSERERIDILFLATLSRLPLETERKSAVEYVQAESESGRALGDILWAVLNSAEFLMNH